jgi:peptide-methionine (S)-S-oxide reductase
MIRRISTLSSIGLALAAGLATALAGAAIAAAPAGSPASAPKATTSRTIEHAYFAMGCFWSGESAFEGVKGVRSVTSGYTGGPEQHPTYEQVSSGTTGHFESVDVAFDPAATSYDKLLDVFWHNIDPTQGDGQFCDRGQQYRTAIFYRDSAQAHAARESKRALEVAGTLHKPIVTMVRSASPFWPAEEYHQDFAAKNPAHYHAYREGCGRDRRLEELWGKDARRGSVPH